jgi:hypothetical protein
MPRPRATGAVESGRPRVKVEPRPIPDSTSIVPPRISRVPSPRCRGKRRPEHLNDLLEHALKRGDRAAAYSTSPSAVAITVSYPPSP